VLRNIQYIIGSVFCIGLGAWATWGGLNLQLFVMGVPAAGLFPFLFGAVLVTIGLASLFYDVRNYKANISNELPQLDYTGIRKVLSYIGLSISCTLLIPYFGFVIPSFVLLFVLFMFVEDIDWKPSLYLSSGFIIFCDVLFIRMLGVQLQSFNI
jgi:hypothetical protein